MVGEVMEILDGEKLSAKIKSEIKSEVKELMIKPCIAVIQVGNDERGNLYIESKKKACSEVGIYFKHIRKAICKWTIYFRR